MGSGHLVIILIIISVSLITLPVFGQNEITIDKEKASKLFANEKYKELISYAEEILELNPNDENAFYYKGLAFLYQANYEIANYNFDKALEINPSHEDALDNKVVALFNIAYRLNERDRYEQALPLLERALEIDPEDLNSLIEITFTLNSLERNEEALSYGNKAIMVYPEDFSLLNNKGTTLFQMADYEEAIKYFDMSLEINPENLFALFNKGTSLYELGRYEEARTYFDKALEIDPKDEDAQYFKRLTLEALGENGGGCLIATATYGSELAPQVQMLRELRDNSLLQTQSGQSFMQGFNEFYYSFSPTIADLERENPIFKEAVKITITPLITSLSLLNYVEIDSESEVLGYGISLIECWNVFCSSCFFDISYLQKT